MFSEFGVVAFVEPRLGLAFAEHRRAFRAVDDVAEEVVALVHVPALGEQARAIRESVFRGVMIEQLVGVLAHLPPALPWTDTGQAFLTQQQTSML